MSARFLLLATLLVFAAGPSPAQTNSVVSVVGTVDRIDAATISVKAEGGGVESLRLAPDLLVLQSRAVTLADIKPNDFIASAAVRGTDRKLHSTELRIFPEALRGVGEGQRPMSDPSQTMTNATVTGVAIVSGSNTIKVRFEGGESELVVDPGIPVTRIDTVDRSLVRAGARVQVRGVRAADGAIVNRITLQ